VAMDSSVKYGFGVTTPNEMAHLFELMALGKAVNPAADSAMLDILEHNTTDFMLQRYAGGARAEFARRKIGRGAAVGGAGEQIQKGGHIGPASDLLDGLQQRPDPDVVSVRLPRRDRPRNPERAPAAKRGQRS
ncbi:MAG: serine hydrolase, partial [Gemmatimonadaceae bacterium]